MDLTDLPLIDGHGHPLLRDPWAVLPDRFCQFFTEGRPGTMTEHLVHAGYFQRALTGMADLLGSAATVGAVLERRRAVGSERAREALTAARIDALLIDTGYPPDAMSLDEMRRLMPCAIHEIVRSESCAQDLLGAGLGWDEFVEAYRRTLRERAATAVSLKSIIAYRSGLAIRSWSDGEARGSYQQAVERLRTTGSPRLTDKPVLDTLFGVTLDVGIETGRPVQVHAGWGDTDIDLPLANPTLLRPTLEDPRWRDARIVVLHQAYPFVREAAFLAAVWPQVYLDLSLAIPYLGPGAMGPLVEILSLAPWSKLCYGSDVQGLPEMFALSAAWGRAALGEALDWLGARRGLGPVDGRDVARRILSANAKALYRI